MPARVLEKKKKKIPTEWQFYLGGGGGVGPVGAQQTNIF